MEQKTIYIYINYTNFFFVDVSLLVAVFSCTGAAGTMDLNELWMLVKDTKLLDSQSLSLNDVQHLFTATAEATVHNKDTLTTAGNSATGNTTGTSINSTELMASQFVEVLVRIADSKFHHLALAWSETEEETSETSKETSKEISKETSKETTASPNKGESIQLLSLANCVEKMLNEYVIPYACRSDADRFRRDLSRTEVKAVFRNHRDRKLRDFINNTV